jgi:hypothetical protein
VPLTQCALAELLDRPERTHKRTREQTADEYPPGDRT